jgi:multidrug resistance efflux pump
VSAAQSICKAARSSTQIIIIGFTRADTTVAITSEVSGRCKEVFVDIGDPVPGDSVFAKIDSTFTDIDLTANKISIAKAEKNFLFYNNQVARHTTLFSSKTTALTRLEELELRADLSRLAIEELKTGGRPAG